jgi:hypothetical protein
LYPSRIELLRSQVIGLFGTAIADQPQGLGLALFLSEGMLGWLKNVAEALALRAIDSAPTHDDSPQSSALAERLSCTQRNAITALLASLVLSTLPVPHESSREGYR